MQQLSACTVGRCIAERGKLTLALMLVSTFHDINHWRDNVLAFNGSDVTVVQISFRVIVFVCEVTILCTTIHPYVSSY